MLCGRTLCTGRWRATKRSSSVHPGAAIRPSLGLLGLDLSIVLERTWHVTLGLRQCFSTNDDVEGTAKPQQAPRPRLRYVRPLALRFTPSEVLIEALAQGGHDHAIPRRCLDKTDLSRISPLKLLKHKASGVVGPTSNVQALEDRKASLSSASGQDMSLQLILAEYIRSNPSEKIHGGSGLQDLPWTGPAQLDLTKVFDDGALEFLQCKGYNVEDVVTWASIITDKSSHRAAARLLAVCNGGGGLAQRAVPVFVPLFLLRRKQLTASALRILLQHAWDRLENRHNPNWQRVLEQNSDSLGMTSVLSKSELEGSTHPLQSPYPAMSRDTLAVLGIRLIRHALKIWPAGIMGITTLLMRHIDYVCSGNPQREFRRTAYLTFFFNKLLSLLSNPSLLSPYLTIGHQARAQILLLEKMAGYEPPLVVNTEGYRAAIRVRLAHRKLRPERRWARLQSKSWPPVKEDRYGLDAKITARNGGQSQAAVALAEMRRAGYAPRDFESAASVLAGWDPDGSPTIQTRRLPGGSRRSADDDAGQLWETRVQATRTVEEAWGEFLQYVQRVEKEQGGKPKERVYLAMMEKLNSEKGRVGKLESARGGPIPAVVSNKSSKTKVVPLQDDLPLPGDGLETAAPPTDPHERRYVSHPVPTIEEHLAQMLANGIRLSGMVLARLVQQAESTEQGAKYLRASNLPRASIEHLLSGDSPRREILQGMHPAALAAYIRMLTNVTSRATRDGTASKSAWADAMTRATALVLAASPLHRPVWNAALDCLARSRPIRRPETAAQTWERMVALADAMRDLDLDLDLDGFLSLCTGFEAAVTAAVGRLHTQQQHRPWHDGKRLALVSKGVARLKDTFRSIVGASYDRDGHDMSHDIDATQTVRSTDTSGETEIEQVDMDAESERQSSKHRPFVKPLHQHRPSVPHHHHGNPSSSPLSSSPSLTPSSLPPSFPVLLEAPAPVFLHGLVRALGTAGDARGILALLRWASGPQIAPEVHRLVVETASGRRALARTLAAARMFLETTDGSSGGASSGSGSGRAGGSLLDCARTAIERVPEWDWPSSVDVARYARGEMR